MTERDDSDEAIRQRYDRANVKAIVVSDRQVFDSLQDIFYLLRERKKCTCRKERPSETPKTV